MREGLLASGGRRRRCLVTFLAFAAAGLLPVAAPTGGLDVSLLATADRLQDEERPPPGADASGLVATTGLHPERPLPSGLDGLTTGAPVDGSGSRPRRAVAPEERDRMASAAARVAMRLTRRRSPHATPPAFERRARAGRLSAPSTAPPNLSD